MAVINEDISKRAVGCTCTAPTTAVPISDTTGPDNFHGECWARYDALAIAKDIALERAPKVRLVLACLLIQLLSTNATEVTSYINQSRVLLFQRQGI